MLDLGKKIEEVSKVKWYPRTERLFYLLLNIFFLGELLDYTGLEKSVR